MRFSAEITTQEDRYDAKTSECVSTYNFTTSCETESIQCTINLRPKGRRSTSVPNYRRKPRLVMSSSSSSRLRKKRDPGLTEEEELELCRLGLGMGNGGRSEEKRKEEEELQKKMRRKPSRKVSREGDFVVIQEISGIKMTQTGSQQIREERVRIGSDEYYYMLKQGLLKTTNDLGES